MSKMKIGILTFQWALNFGAHLQARSLVKFVKSLGYQSELIPFVPVGRRDELSYFRKRFWRGGLTRFVQRVRFRRYCRESMGVDPLEAYSSRDTIIVGSDQVWNPRITGSSCREYFLEDEVARGVRVVSYAACCGEGQMLGELTRLGASAIAGHFAVSTRDALTADIVRAVSGRVAQVVVDPSLLDYPEQKDASYLNGESLLAYFVNPVDTRVYQSLAKEAARLGVRLRVVGGGDANEGERFRLASLGPNDWYELIQGARAVYTDSYHGSIVAIKHNIPFVTQLHPRRGDRITDLFERLKLNSRIAVDGNIAGLRNQFMFPPMDAARRETLVVWSKESGRFLENALSKDR